MSGPSHAPVPASVECADSPSARESPQALTTENDETTTAREEHDNEDREETDQEEEESRSESHEAEEAEEGEDTSAPPLPNEAPPALPNEARPGPAEDDGWEPVWDANINAYYFYNRFTAQSQWENPRVPDAGAPSAGGGSSQEAPKKKSPVPGGYNPAIHGDYDPTAPYAQQYEDQSQDANVPTLESTAAYAATGTFNRFTGRWQAEAMNPENHNDENKSRRQMNAFFDVDSAANSHDGRSLRAERSAKKLSKKELKMFKEKRREKKEEKRRAWLRD